MCIILIFHIRLNLPKDTLVVRLWQPSLGNFEFPISTILCSRRRDAAHLKIKQIFYDVIAKRRAAKEPEDDILQTLIESEYK